MFSVKYLENRVRNFDSKTGSNTIDIRFIVKTNLLTDIPSIVRMNTWNKHFTTIEPSANGSFLDFNTTNL